MITSESPYLMYYLIKLATTAKLVIVMTMTLLTFGRSIGIKVAYDELQAKQPLLQIKNTINFGNGLNLTVFMFIMYLGFQVARTITSKIINFGRCYFLQIFGGVLLVIWLGKKTSMDYK